MCTPQKRSINKASLARKVDAAVRALADGGVVCVPTDTLYGLAALVSKKAAVERLFRIKGRMATAALPLLVGDVSDIADYTDNVSDLAWRLAERFFPGPLTLILPKKKNVPDIVTGGASTVGIRVPDHDVPRSISRALGEAITGTSANRTGEPGLITAVAVREHLGNDVDCIVDGGRCELGSPSTVLDLSGVTPYIVREGAVSLDAIEETCRQNITRRDNRVG